MALWLLAAGALVCCEAVARLAGRGWPTAARLLRSARERRAGQVGLVLAWLWLGWHVFAR